MADVRAQLVVISIVPVTQAICTTVVKTLLPHDLDVKDNTLTVGFVIPTVGKFAMCKSTILYRLPFITNQPITLDTDPIFDC